MFVKLFLFIDHAVHECFRLLGPSFQSLLNAKTRKLSKDSPPLFSSSAGPIIRPSISQPTSSRSATAASQPARAPPATPLPPIRTAARLSIAPSPAAAARRLTRIRIPLPSSARSLPTPHASPRSARGTGHRTDLSSPFDRASSPRLPLLPPHAAAVRVRGHAAAAAAAGIAAVRVERHGSVVAPAHGRCAPGKDECVRTEIHRSICAVRCSTESARRVDELFAVHSQRSRSSSAAQ